MRDSESLLPLVWRLAEALRASRATTAGILAVLSEREGGMPGEE